jgi:hypothetical protein
VKFCGELAAKEIVQIEREREREREREKEREREMSHHEERRRKKPCPSCRPSVVNPSSFDLRSSVLKGISESNEKRVK